MKQFFKYVAATIVGLFAFCLIFGIFGFISLIGMVASSSSTPTIKDKSVMVLTLQGEIIDRAEDNWLGQITGNQFNTLGMNEILSAIKKAKTEEKIKGIYLEAGALQADYATIHKYAMHSQISRKAANGLLLTAMRFSQGSYYLASIANQVYVNP